MCEETRKSKKEKYQQSIDAFRDERVSMLEELLLISNDIKESLTILTFKKKQEGKKSTEKP